MAEDSLLLSDAKFKPKEDFERIAELTRSISDVEQQLLALEAGQKSVASACDLKRSLAYDYNERGFRYYTRVEFKLAVDDYTKSIDYGQAAGSFANLKTLSAAFYNRGTVRYRMSNFLDARKDLEEAVRLQPKNKEFILAMDAALNQQKLNDMTSV